jgi:hypothetical protein
LKGVLGVTLCRGVLLGTAASRKLNVVQRTLARLLC